MRDDLFYTQKMVEQRDLEPDYEEDIGPEQELPIKKTDVFLGRQPSDEDMHPAPAVKKDKEKDTTTFALTAMGENDEEDS